MPRSFCYLLVLAALAAGSGLAFAAAAAEAAGPAPPSPLAAKAAAAAPRSAADGGTAIEAGDRIGEIVKSWGAALLLGIAGLMGLAALARRSLGEGLTLLVITILVGGFVFAPDQVKAFIQSLWQPISGG